MSFLPYRTGAIFFPLKNHNNFAAEAAFLCRIVTVVTRFLHSLALARKERSDGIAIVRCKRNLPFPFGSLGRVALRSRASMTQIEVYVFTSVKMTIKILQKRRGART